VRESKIVRASVREKQRESRSKCARERARESKSECERGRARESKSECERERYTTLADPRRAYAQNPRWAFFFFCFITLKPRVE